VLARQDNPGLRAVDIRQAADSLLAGAAGIRQVADSRPEAAVRNHHPLEGAADNHHPAEGAGAAAEAEAAAGNCPEGAMAVDRS
jgi:hypothetical protein